ncbi:MAG TPA: hypothetical protein DEP45_01750 [Armatimonadetes bacterium]|nr:hypothetical protein [Armatimonadota bacterium]
MAMAGIAAAQNVADIVVGGQVVARIRTGGEYGSINQRQAAIDQRIVKVLSDERGEIFIRELDGPRLKVFQANGRWALGIGNTTIIDVYPEDAAGTPAKTVIEQWKANFFRQLPKAVSPIHVPQWWKDAHPDEVASTEKKMHNLPPEDAVLIREIAEIFEAARTMGDDDFNRLLPGMERSVIDYVWSYRHPACGAAPITENIRAKSGLKRARGLSPEQYAAEQWWMTGLTIEKLRETMRMPAGVGPIPEQREVPDFEAAISAPAPVAPAPVTPEPVTPAPVAPAPVAPEPVAPGGATEFAAPVSRVLVCTALGPNNDLETARQDFSGPVRQLMVYLKLDSAAPNTIVGVTVGRGAEVEARRLLRVTGDRSLAVTFYPARGSTSLEPGDYKVLLTVDGEEAGVVPFRIGPAVEN